MGVCCVGVGSVLCGLLVFVLCWSDVLSFATGVTEHVCWFSDVVVLAFVGSVLVSF